jgi:hypothetical protein
MFLAAPPYFEVDILAFESRLQVVVNASNQTFPKIRVGVSMFHVTKLHRVLVRAHFLARLASHLRIKKIVPMQSSLWLHFYAKR